MKQIYRDFHRLLLVALALLCAGFAYGQRTITGTVTDKDGPVIQATVMIKGTTKGTVTDFDGNYSIEVPDDNAVLVFSYVGMKTQEKSVKGKTKIDVFFGVDTKVLGDVVVVGYSVQKKEDLTGAVTSMTGDDIADRPVIGVDQAMQGKAAGVQVTTSSGAPGAGVQVRIRGTNSINGGDPLYVVDGVPIGSDISHLNPGDIESISVLKDASSAAIYGARGANGVVLIKLKAGAKGFGDKCESNSVSFDAYVGIQNRWKEVDVMGAEDYVNTLRQVGYDVDNIEVPDYATTTGAGTNWQDEVYRQAYMKKFQVNIMGASENNNYSISASFFDQQGIVQRTDFRRITFGVKTQHTPFANKKFRTGQGIGFNFGKQNKVPQGDLNNSILAASLFMDPTVPAKDVSFDGTRTDGWVGLGAFTQNSVQNPSRWLEIQDNYEEKMGLGGNLWAEYAILDNLKFKSTLGYALWMPKETWFRYKYYSNTSHFRDKANLETVSTFGYNWTNNNVLTWTKEIRNKVDSNLVDHNISFLLGQEAFENYQEATRLSTSGYFSEAEAQQYHHIGDDKENQSQEWDKPASYSMLSYFARGTYGLKDKYLVTASLRRDASSKVPDSTRWDMFPSFSLGWKIHKENFFRTLPIAKHFEELKLRFGWGELGSESTLGPYPSSAVVYKIERNYTFGGEEVPGMTRGRATTSSVRWERQRQWNIGTDINLWKNKVLYTVDYFSKKTIDMIVKKPLNPLYGGESEGDAAFAAAPFIEENAGIMSNKGLEMSLQYRNKMGALNYSIGGSYTRVISNVDELGGGVPQAGGTLTAPIGYDVSLTTEGFPYACFYGFIVDQENPIYKSDDEVKESGLTGIEVGDFRFIDVNGDGTISDADKVIMGSPHPDFTYGFFINGSVKAFDFNVALQGSYGNEIFNATKYYLHGSNIQNYAQDVKLYETDELNADGSTKMSTGSWGKPHSEFIEDGSYMRLKDVSVGFTLPENVTQKLKIKKLRVYVQSQNLLTFTSYSGADPELSITQSLKDQGSLELGVDRGNYPQARTFLFGVNLGL